MLDWLFPTRVDSGEQVHRQLSCPTEHITRVIIEGLCYHKSYRGNPDSNFYQFCDDHGVTLKRRAFWRPVIEEILREELAAYAPVGGRISHPKQRTVKPKSHVNRILDEQNFELISKTAKQVVTCAVI